MGQIIYPRKHRFSNDRDGANVVHGLLLSETIEPATSIANVTDLESGNKFIDDIIEWGTNLRH